MEALEPLKEAVLRPANILCCTTCPLCCGEATTPAITTAPIITTIAPTKPSRFEGHTFPGDVERCNLPQAHSRKGNGYLKSFDRPWPNQSKISRSRFTTTLQVQPAPNGSNFVWVLRSKKGKLPIDTIALANNGRDQKIQPKKIEQERTVVATSKSCTGQNRPEIPT